MLKLATSTPPIRRTAAVIRLLARVITDEQID
jgi:hypothetical protein